jgi:hypothetical protein
MATAQRLDYLRVEHERILDVAGKIEKALMLISKTEFTDRLSGILQLRELDHGIVGIAEHCHSENRLVESTYHQFLDAGQWTRIKAEHEKLLRLISAFRVELRFATADLTNGLEPAGRQLIGELRAHVGYEQQLLGEIERLKIAN